MTYWETKMLKTLKEREANLKRAKIWLSENIHDPSYNFILKKYLKAVINYNERIKSRDTKIRNSNSLYAESALTYDSYRPMVIGVYRTWNRRSINE